MDSSLHGGPLTSQSIIVKNAQTPCYVRETIFPHNNVLLGHLSMVMLVFAKNQHFVRSTAISLSKNQFPIALSLASYPTHLTLANNALLITGVNTTSATNAQLV
jgi:hypothetical protein